MIYTLTALTENGKDQRVFGYFNTLEKAREAALKNYGGMSECLYSFLLIEMVPEGIHSFATQVEWYYWEDNKNFLAAQGKTEPSWIKTDQKPEWAYGTTNFSMG